MDTTSSPPLEELVDTDNHQPPVTGSPPPAALSSAPQSPTDEVDQQELINSNPPYSPSLNSVNRQPPEDSRQHTPPEEQTMDYQLPSSPPSKVTEQPPENANPSSNQPPPDQPPSPLLLTAPLEHKDPPESPKFDSNPNKVESPISKQPESPDFDACFDNERPKKIDSPVRKDPYSAGFDACFDNEPPKKIDSPEHDYNADFNACFDNPKKEDSTKPHESSKEDMPGPQPPLLLHAVASASPVRPQISAWTHEETVNLIEAYQEKWYSIKKGPLKAGQWEEVAITVAARCGYDEPTKTSKQCRHKLEKLRKRYRAERMNSRSKANAWSFFKMMDNMERGPLPISSSPMTMVEYQKPSGSNGRKRKNDDVGGGVGVSGEFLVNKRSARARSSINHSVVNGGLASNLRLPSFPDGGSRIVRGLRTPMVQKRRGFYQGYDGGEKEHNKVEKEDDDSDNDADEEDVATQLAAEIKGFAEKFVKMENKKLEMMRDVERYRLEMEDKRMEMILQSQRMLVETVNKAFGGSHKPHKLSAK